MIADFYQKLALPDACYLGKRVYKKLFYENVSLSALDKKYFIEDVVDIQWSYTLKPDTIAIARYEDNEREYHEIALMQVNLKNDQHSKRLAQIIQRAIPYPLLIVFTQGSRFALNMADKRINQADRDKIRVEVFYDTAWLDLANLTATEAAFIDSCVCSQFSYQHFYAFYSDLLARVIALNCSQVSGQYRLDTDLTRDEQVDWLNKIRQTEQKLQSLRADLKKESQFNRQVQLNIQIRQVVQQLAELKR
jgi:hypothetical protein